MSDEKNIFSRAEEFMQLFKKGADFTQDLLKENERLRFKIVQLEEKNNVASTSDSGTDDKRVTELNKKLQTLEQELQKLHQRHKEVEAENQDFANRYLEVQNENNHMANLYIASFQLHSTLDSREVLQVVMEIIINLIGAEIFGILLLDEKTSELTAVSTEGIDREEIPLIRLGVGIIGGVAKSGEDFFVEEIKPFDKFDPQTPIVCIPLKIKDHVIGVIVIYKLLQQKSKFTELDYELFSLLAGHAATAIFSSRLYSESERKLSTIQGFINFLTK